MAMKNLRELWGTRFIHYMTEFQKYMKYVVTGHLALVLVFAIGAGG
ncbi:ABC transporter permease, partial [Microvirga sp. 3-52]|nr:ABC transporter permease [Microvirga sp. 3-52]